MILDDDEDISVHISKDPDPDRRDRYFLVLFIVIIIAWTIVPLWGRFIDNASTTWFGLDLDRPLDDLALALVVTLAFMAFVVVFNLSSLVDKIGI